MRCLKCSAETRVIGTEHPVPWLVVRRRKCLGCKWRFNTIERYDPYVTLPHRRGGKVRLTDVRQQILIEIWKETWYLHDG